MTDDVVDPHDLEITMFTAVSVALESLEKMFNMTKAVPGVSAIRVGYFNAALSDARRHVDAFLDDQELSHIEKAGEIMDSLHAQLKEWKV